MARVLLVQPHRDRTQECNDKYAPPSSLVYLATAIEDKHHVRIYDRNVYEDDARFVRYLKEYNPQILGFTAMTSSMLHDLVHLGPIIKKVLPNVTLIVGGVHPTIEPDSVLNEPYVDYIMRGEGEEAFLEFCDVFDKNPKKLKKLKNINKNPLRPFIDLDKLKTPNYGLVEMKKYRQFFIGTSRGCPGNCSFCYNVGMWGKEGYPCVRILSVENAKKVFREFIEKYGVKDFTIMDENFITFKDRCIEICKFLEKKYKGKINFLIFGRADFIKRNEEALEYLKRAGCHSIQMGSESGSQRILDILNKNIDVKTQGEVFDICRKHKIWSDASFMLGLPTETLEEMRMTKNFIKRYKPDVIDLKIFNPIPGTRIFDDLVKKGVLKRPKTLKEWADWTGDLGGIKHNVSAVPDEHLLRMAKDLWRMNYHNSSRLKKAIFWIKRGRVRYVLRRAKEIIFRDKFYLSKNN
jgi:radical SAM superfamily enzyme YgiQ (UPF0313 family)